MFKKFFLAMAVLGAMLLSAPPAYCSSDPGIQIYNYTIRNNSDYMLSLDREKGGYKTKILRAYPRESSSTQDTREPGTIYINLRKKLNSSNEQVICTKKWPSKKKSVHIVVSSKFSCTFEFSD